MVILHKVVTHCLLWLKSIIPQVPLHAILHRAMVIKLYAVGFIILWLDCWKKWKHWS